MREKERREGRERVELLTGRAKEASVVVRSPCRPTLFVEVDATKRGLMLVGDSEKPGERQKQSTGINDHHPLQAVEHASQRCRILPVLVGDCGATVFGGRNGVVWRTRELTEYSVDVYRVRRAVEVYQESQV